MKHPALLALAAGLVAGAAHAGTVQIAVTGPDGKPAADVVVLIDPASKVAATPAAKPVLIDQKNLRFEPFLTVVPVGSTLRFANRDGYDHHVRSTPSGPLGSMPSVKNFELRLDGVEAASPDPYDPYQSTPATTKKKSGKTWAEVKVGEPGPIGLGCHLHSSMRGQVYVSATPWYAKTDAHGLATLEGVPEGAIEINVWHPDQLAEQATLRTQATAQPLKVSAQLNFTPRQRRN